MLLGTLRIPVLQTEEGEQACHALEYLGPQTDPVKYNCFLIPVLRMNCIIFYR